MKFVMSENPSKNWGNTKEEIPVSKINQHIITPIPYVSHGKSVFFDQQQITLSCIDNKADIYYSLEKDANPNKIYTQPILIHNSAHITAKAVSPNLVESFKIKAKFNKIPEGRTITIKHPYANQYNAGGDVALIDHQRGGNNFRTGSWQGYEKVNLEAIIDLGKSETIQQLSTGFLQDINAWIFMPEYVDYYSSNDGKKFKKLGRIKTPVKENEEEAQTNDFKLIIKPIKMRYIKIIAKNKSFCPAWHKGAGNPCWIFADEVVIGD